MSTYTTQLQAEVATADATWSLVSATFGLMLVTVGAVLVALFTPVWERGARRREQAELDRRTRWASMGAMVEALDLMHDCATTLAPTEPMPEQLELWRRLNLISVSRRVLEHYFGFRWEHDPDLPRMLATTLQGLHEVRDAVVGLRPGQPHAQGGSEGRINAGGTLTRALERVATVEEQVRSEMAEGGKDVTDNQFTWRLENLRGAFEFGSRALQAVLVVNGGAAVALLALLGNLAAHPQGITFHLALLRLSLGLFSLGSLLATVAMALGWGAQLRTLDATASRDPGMGLRYGCLGVGICGMLAFTAGVGFAAMGVG
jgi:hypothetical protein